MIDLSKLPWSATDGRSIAVQFKAMRVFFSYWDEPYGADFAEADAVPRLLLTEADRRFLRSVGIAAEDQA